MKMIQRLTLAAVLAGAVLLAMMLVDEPPAAPESAMPLTAAERGRALAAALGCVACHSLDGAPGIGPSWKDSYGALRTFTDGSSARVDDDYVRSSIQDPAARVVNGYQNVMLPVTLTAAQTEDIIALFRDLTLHQSE